MDGTAVAKDVSSALRSEEPTAGEGEVGKFEEIQEELAKLVRMRNANHCLGCGRETSHIGNFSDKRTNEPRFVEEEYPSIRLDCIANLNAAFSKHDECYKDGWEFTFVGCCHDQYDFCNKCDPVRSCAGNFEPNHRPVSKNISHHKYALQEDLHDEMSPLTTQFNVTALVPSIRRLYVDLWDTIELSLLGYYDADETEQVPTNSIFLHHPTHHSQFPVPAIMRILRTSVLPELAEYLYFVVGFKPLTVR
eukprot:CAMPEP_0172548068 /NCGR_PEP_ID=MMETSP1067-20121228/17465_1 /TAXON_ID=265564 ORGANISM="Thalassiosira punctigera, Strain Tpunct2005C2" /NCGR_SAMPLE_ID=MMETSP1067 /ASSEMBLY_ACC=CAM_ASM_000444 /LENGTH=248 /DNA_ID=CAMNT_0013335253 /DNA_START=231 /DNA_END=975 /DNA_ORIENTATION=+